MTITTGTRDAVRRRAGFACEYCGVSETDTGGELTIDHYQPQTKGGTDALENLLYCCVRCNQYKADYWPVQPNEPALWNPRTDVAGGHFVQVEDGTLHPLTVVGRFTLQRLRLNRAPLVAYRRRQTNYEEERRLLQRYQDSLELLERLHAQQVALLQEQQQLLAEQRALLRALLDEGME